MEILSWNVNGIRAAAGKGLITWLKARSPDILCVQESKARREQLSDEIANVDGYESHWHWPTEKKGYSGVGIYTKVKPVSVDTGMGVPEFDAEGRVQTITYNEFTLLNVYFPNGQRDQARLDYKLAFYDAFRAYVLKLRSTGRKLVMVGDYNTAHHEIDLARPKENEGTSGFLPVERKWLDTFIADGNTDTFRMYNTEGGNYTWWDVITRARDRNVGWRIDYIFVSDVLTPQVRNAFILPDITGSDHCPVGINLSNG
jgi:exodeoxyribonuclease-3